MSEYIFVRDMTADRILLNFPFVRISLNKYCFITKGGRSTLDACLFIYLFYFLSNI